MTKTIPLQIDDNHKQRWSKRDTGEIDLKLTTVKKAIMSNYPNGTIIVIIVVYLTKKYLIILCESLDVDSVRFHFS